MLITMLVPEALAIGCEDIVGLVGAGVSSDLVVQTIQAASAAPSRADIDCMVRKKLPDQVVRAARVAAGVGEPTKESPGENTEKGEPVQDRFEDWTVLRLNGSVGAGTKAVNDRTLVLDVSCEAGTLLRISLMNITLMMMNVPYRTEISYDAGPFVRVEDDTSLPVEHLARMQGASRMYVRWSFYEGTVSGEFSLRGSRSALRPVMDACSMPSAR